MIYWTASVGWKQHSDRAENLLRGLGQQQNKATEKYDDGDSSRRTELKVQVIELKAFKTFFITLEKYRCHLPYQHNPTKGRRLCYPKIFGKMPAKLRIIVLL